MSEHSEEAGRLAAGYRATRTAVEAYLGSHHVMTICTYGPISPDSAPVPHAATVFYAVRRNEVEDEFGRRVIMELIFAGKADSRHGRHVAAGTEGVPVAATVSEHYDNWRDIRGVQVWGRAFRLRGVARGAALAVYTLRFPFVTQLMKESWTRRLPADIGLFSLRVERVAYTDNAIGAFGRQEATYSVAAHECSLCGDGVK